ncbi:DUF397 domain-containing protein [Streptomyces sp. NPDC050315]|uniref:DUF397 domain-containing protein n=1 Tax=Streptomyces sp. NPDC050315 TaxID=3155039 RepID=UPI0034222049
MNNDLAWFKSSYSGGQDEACIEVAVAWRKSSYSGSEGEACVEVAACPDAIHIRDSKDTARRPLTVSPGAWADFAQAASTGAFVAT